MDDVEKLMQRMWQPAQPSRRGPKAALSTERIVEAAFELANEHGVEALAMARIAGTLGVSPMALYRHVGSKDELLTLLADRVARDIEPIDVDLPWREGLNQWTRAQIRLAFTYPWFMDLPLSNVMPGPNRLRWIDQLFGILASTPLHNDEKLAVAGLLAQHVLGQARILIESGQLAYETSKGEGSADDAGAEAPQLPADPFSSLEPLLRSFGDPNAFPHLLEALAQEDAPLPLPIATTEPTSTIEDEITFGLDIMLDGIEAYVRRREAEQSR